MFSRTFEYTGYDGQPHKDTWYFNLTEAELYEMELGSVGGLEGTMQRLLREEKPKEIVDMCKGLILGSVGERSADGRKFVKNEEIRMDFYQSKAYAMLFTELVSSGEKMSAFIYGCIPEELAAKLKDKKEEDQPKLAVVSSPTTGDEAK